MRVNVYAEEMSGRIEDVVTVTAEGETYHGVRFFLLFPGQNWFIHRKKNGGMDDDSTAVTFWGSPKRLRETFEKALEVVRSIEEDSGK